MFCSGRTGFCTENGSVPEETESRRGEAEPEEGRERHGGKASQSTGKSGLGLEETGTRTKATAGGLGWKEDWSKASLHVIRHHFFYITSGGCQQRPEFPSKTSAVGLCLVDMLVGWNGLLGGS